MSSDLLLILKAIIIGIVEGITEFLPISSTGHMIIVGHFINFEGDFAKLFEIVIQLGAILAIVVLFRQKIINSLRSLAPGGSGFKLWTGIIIAFIPSGIVGILFHKKVEEYLMTPLTVAAALVVGGLWIIFAENKYRKSGTVRRLEDVSYKQALAIGCFQCLALLWPGFSRSASTIIGGWMVGLSTVAAAEFSFFLALPTMVIASGYELVKSSVKLAPVELAALVTGFVVSFIVALVVVEKFINFLKKRRMRLFAMYRILVGIIVLSLALAGVI